MMNQGIVRREIEIDAPVAEVWPLVATEEGLRQWWGNEITLEPQEGGRCTERLVVQGQEIIHQGIVSVYAPPHQLTLTFSQETHSAAADVWSAPSRVSITLESVAPDDVAGQVVDEMTARTRVAVVHHVFHALPAAVDRSAPVSAAAFGPQMAVPAAGPVTLRPAQPALLALHRLDRQQQWELRLRRLAVYASGEAVQHA